MNVYIYARGNPRRSKIPDDTESPTEQNPRRHLMRLTRTNTKGTRFTVTVSRTGIDLRLDFKGGGKHHEFLPFPIGTPMGELVSPSQAIPVLRMEGFE